MTTATDFSVKFWGVRGTVSTPATSHLRYGGNTTCLEVRCGEKLIILDAGTGIRPLGNELAAKGGVVDADIFFTHTHVDHIAGLPFFRPMYDPKSRLRLWAGHLAPELSLNDVLCRMMSAPLFPVPFEILEAVNTTIDFRAGENFELSPGVRLRTAPLNHPDRATGYRIEFGGKSICFITDTEHVPDKPDRTILDLIAGTDIFIYDCTYTDEEYKGRVGWGHSTWQEGIRLAEMAHAKTLVIFHHDPDHDDAFMDRVASDADKARPGTLVAREGLVLHP